MKWYILILLLISYPIIELTRFIIHYLTLYPELWKGFIWELALMWLAFIAGIFILAWRVK